MNITVEQSNKNDVVINVSPKFIAYLRFRFGQMKVLFIVNCLLGIVFYPLLAVTFARMSHIDDSPAAMMGLGVDLGLVMLMTPLVIPAIFIMTYICGLVAFNYIHNRNISDMHLSLPLTHCQRYWANFIAGLSICVIPYLVSLFAGLLIFASGANTKWIQEEFELSMGKIIAEYLIPVGMIGLVTMLFIFALTMLCNSLCGKTLTAGFFPFLISAIIPLLILSLSSLAIYHAWGIDHVGALPYIISTPLGFLFGSTIIVPVHQIVTVTKPVYILPTIVVIAGMITASYYLIKHAKAENIGRDFLYKFIYNIQQSLVCLCIVSLFGLAYLSFTNALIAFLTIFVSFVAYFIGHVVHHKGLGQMKNGVIKYTVIVLSSILLCVILMVSRGFGAESYIPPSFDIQGVKIQYWSGTYDVDVQSAKNPFPDWNFVRYSDGEHTREEWRQLTDEVRRIHKGFIDNPAARRRADEEFGWFGGTYGSTLTVTVEYELGSGIIVARNYTYSSDDMDTLIKAGVIREKRRFEPVEPDLPDDFRYDEKHDYDWW
jgi:hypothetical protein